MIKRNGFVSNSSSSSFILIGIALDSKYSEDEDFMEILLDDKTLDVCFETSHNFDLVGEFISDGYDEDIDTGIIDLNSNYDNVLTNLQKYFPDTKKEDLKIYYGTYAC